MSFGLLERARRNIGIRLSLWYALIFTLSSVALLALAYYLLAAAIGSKDREVLEAQLREYAAIYDRPRARPGCATRFNRRKEARQTFFVRLVSAWNDVSFVNVPGRLDHV